MKSISILRLLVIAVVTIPLFNCKSKSQKDPVKSASTEGEFIYKFNDASVPPEYHRSYLIRVTPSMLYLTVDSYGDILLKDSASFTDAEFKDFARQIDQFGIKSKNDDGKTDGCAGGTSEVFELFKGSSKAISGYISRCGGDTDGTLSGPLDRCSRLFKSIYPELSKKVD